MTVCEEIITDSDDENRVSLVHLVSTIRSTSEPPYPVRQPQLCVFIQLAECREEGKVRIEIREADTEDIIFATPTRTVAVPDSPLTLHGLRFRILGCSFPRAGLYWVQFWCDEQMLAQHAIHLC